MNKEKQDHINALTHQKLTLTMTSFGRKATASLLQELDDSLSRHEAKALEESLIHTASLWQNINLLDACVRAACIILMLEPPTTLEPLLRAVQSPHINAANRPTQAVIITRFLLNDPHLIQDISTPFDVTTELGLHELTTSMLAIFCTRTNTALQHMTLEDAKTIAKTSELRADTWQDRVQQLAKKYEEKTYNTAVSGSSST